MNLRLYNSNTFIVKKPSEIAWLRSIVYGYIVKERQIPAIVALIRFDNVAANKARIASLESTGVKLGSTTLKAPITIPIELKFAKPHSPNEIIAAVCGEIL